MITVTRKLEFDAAHRVLGHEGKCRHLHGHRYVVEVTVSTRRGIMDELGMVVDFSVIKTKVGGWIDKNWDHNILLHIEDPLIKLNGMGSAIWGGREPYIFENNPTAERMAEELAMVVNNIFITDGLTLERIRVYETPNCWADWEKVS